MGQVAENAVEYLVHFDSQFALQLINIYKIFEDVIFLDAGQSCPEYRMHVEHYVFGCVFHGFLLLQFVLTEVLEGYGNYIANSLHQKGLDIGNQISIAPVAV